MPTSTNVTNLKINELTEAQYDTAVQQGVIGENELSVITDASTGVTSVNGQTGDAEVRLDNIISWDDSWTLPTSYSGNILPNFIVRGPLPAGNYSFYLRMLNGYMETGTEAYTEPLIIKVCFTKFSSVNEIYGLAQMVLDGESSVGFSDGAIDYSEVVFNVYTSQEDSDVRLYTNDEEHNLVRSPLARHLSGRVEVPDAISWTKVKNVDTGDLYDMELYSVTSSSEDTTGLSEFGYISQDKMLKNMVQFENYTSLAITQGRGIELLNVGYSTSAEIGMCYSFSVSMSCEQGIFEAEVFYALPKPYSIIKTHTGIFENTTIGLMAGTAAQNVGISYNVPAGTDTIANIVVAKWGSYTQTAPGFVSRPSGVSITEFDKLEVGATITRLLLGKILQYQGATNANYTNGYFYKANGTEVFTPGHYDCTETTGYGFSIEITDTDAFVNAVANDLGMTAARAKQYLNYYTNWYYSDGVWVWTAVGAMAVVDPYITITPTPSAGIEVDFSLSWVGETIEIQNPSWDRVDVQPSTPAPIALSLTIPAANWDATYKTQTIQSASITASNIVFVSPDPASISDWSSSGVWCTGQGAGYLMFECNTIPSNDLFVNVVVLN